MKVATGTKKRLGDLLVGMNLLAEADLDKALRLQVGGNRRLGYLLIKMGFISEGQLQSVLSKQMDLPIVKVMEAFTSSARKILPRYLCRKYSVLPLASGENNTLKVAMVDPSDDEAVSDIEKYTGKIVQPVLASKSDITLHIMSLIPWSGRDIFYSLSSMKFSAGTAIFALALIIFTSVQFHRDRQAELYGTIRNAPNMTVYENLELILGFDDQENVSLKGHGAYSSGNYSVTFDDLRSLRRFIEARKDDFSTRQMEWLSWAMTNPRRSN